MSVKESNEITVKIKGELSKFYEILEQKGFKIVSEFSMDDTYFIPRTLNLEEMSIREILSKAVIVRDIIGKTSGRRNKKITFKIKNFDECGNILSQEAINCDISEIEDAKKFLNAIDYKEIMRIKENDIVYEKDGFELAIKDIENGDNLIEIETEDNEEFDTIEKLIQKVNEIDIPIYTDNYFVKKAEIELEKVLKIKKRDSYEYIGKEVNVEIDRPMNSKHPKHGFIYQINYGFVPNTLSGDGEELDCYVLGINEPIKNFTGECIAVIHRINDNDDKLVIVPKGKNFTDEEIRKATEFQEQYFESEIIRQNKKES